MAFFFCVVNVPLRHWCSPFVRAVRVGSLTSRLHIVVAEPLNPQPLGLPETDGRAWVAQQGSPALAVGSSTSAGLGSLFLNQFIASSMAFFFCVESMCPRHWVLEVRQSRKSGLVDVPGLSSLLPVH
jgi:hypothetical protein